MPLIFRSIHKNTTHNKKTIYTQLFDNSTTSHTGGSAPKAPDGPKVPDGPEVPEGPASKSRPPEVHPSSCREYFRVSSSRRSPSTPFQASSGHTYPATVSPPATPTCCHPVAAGQ